MATSTDPLAQHSSKDLAARIGWLALICATLYVCYFGHLGAIGFVGPDEPRYASIARAMLETGDWVTPRLHDRPWFEKPPLFYWGAAICFKLLGVSEAAARLPSAISALLATLALAWLAWRVYGLGTARWLLVLLPTTVGMIGFSHAAATDMPFSAMLTIAMVCAAEAIGFTDAKTQGRQAPHPAPVRSAKPWHSRLGGVLLFGFFLGLAVLAKGPVGIIVCAGAVFLWALFTKRWRDTLRLFHAAGIATFCATALPWYILCTRRNPDFLRVFIIEHNFKRYLTPEFQHIQPFWFYLPVLAIAFLPWTLTGLFLFRDSLDTWSLASRLRSPQFFLATWAIFPVLFFTFSKSKLPGYVLPALPPACVLLSYRASICAQSSRRINFWARIALALTGVLLGLAFFIPTEWVSFGWTPTVLLASGVLGIFPSGPRRLPAMLGATAIAVVLSLSLGVRGQTATLLDRRASARPALTRAQTTWKDYELDRTSTYKLPRAFQFQLEFYFHRELPAWSPELNQRQWVFAPGKKSAELRELGLDCPFFGRQDAVIVCEDRGSARTSPSGQVQ